MASFRDNDPLTEGLATPAPESPAKPAGEKKAVETWAAAKGCWPQSFAAPPLGVPQGTPGDNFGSVAVNMAAVRAPRANPEYWKFAAAKAMHGWPEGWELTEADFDAAITAATGQLAR